MPDGGLGDRTARMFEPYPGGGDDRGQWVVDPDELPGLIRFCHDLGFPVDCHTCGDECQQLVVSAFAAAQEASPKPWLRHRVHHAYFPTEHALELMARHRIPAVVSSPFIRNLGESYVASVGERAGFRRDADADVPRRAASHWPARRIRRSPTSIPGSAMAAAATRATVAGRVLGASERITAAEALRSYTLGGAYATGRERSSARSSPGSSPISSCSTATRSRSSRRVARRAGGRDHARRAVGVRAVTAALRRASSARGTSVRQ